MKNIVKFLMAAAFSLGSSSLVQAEYFKDDFSWGFNTSLWSARTGDNGTPFGCIFTPSMVSPNSNGITLALSQSSCAELQSLNSYGFGKVQGALKTGNTPGTVASIFTYTSWWEAPGRAWQEIDIEFLGTLGNVVHTNVIYQPQGGRYQSWEQDIDLGQYGLNIQQNLLAIGFDWSESQIRWYVYDADGNEQTIRTVYRDNSDSYLAADEIPAYAWPVDKTRIMINHWHGDNSQEGFYFPGQYSGNSSWVYYDFIEYIPR